MGVPPKLVSNGSADGKRKELWSECVRSSEPRAPSITCARWLTAVQEAERAFSPDSGSITKNPTVSLTTCSCHAMRPGEPSLPCKLTMTISFALKRADKGLAAFAKRPDQNVVADLERLTLVLNHQRATWKRGARGVLDALAGICRSLTRLCRTSRTFRVDAIPLGYAGHSQKFVKAWSVEVLSQPAVGGLASMRIVAGLIAGLEQSTRPSLKSRARQIRSRLRTSLPAKRNPGHDF